MRPSTHPRDHSLIHSRDGESTTFQMPLTQTEPMASASEPQKVLGGGKLRAIPGGAASPGRIRTALVEWPQHLDELLLQDDRSRSHPLAGAFAFQSGHVLVAASRYKKPGRVRFLQPRSLHLLIASFLSFFHRVFLLSFLAQGDFIPAVLSLFCQSSGPCCFNSVFCA